MIVVRIKDVGDIIKARSAVKDVAEKLGFGIVDRTRISTAVSELARNIYLFAKEGDVQIEELSNPHKGIRITFIDHGPGIEDIDLALKDGWSSSNGMGKGLPGARRLVDLMEIESQPGKGTTVIIEKWLKG
ncbi:anti-sigma regulatory factor [candidate division WOR-3 bacterium]|nr:anti-sigma regulatory factor [candidate division WOR-3 bacterium]